MSCMVLHTAESGSREVFLHLRSQNNGVVPSRNHLHAALSHYLQTNDSGPLQSLCAMCRQIAGSASDTFIALVFSSAQSLLCTPFTDAKNVRLLTFLRKAAAIDTVFIPLGDPMQQLKAELGRMRAMVYGNWQFSTAKKWWQRPFTIDYLKQCSVDSFEPVFAHPTSQNYSDAQLVQAVLQRTGRVFDMWQLCSAVFETLRVLDFQDIETNPAQTYHFMAREAGCSWQNDALVNQSYTSSINRFLVYNPIIVQFGSELVHYRFELSSIASLCTDWGDLFKVVSGKKLEALTRLTGSPMSLCVERSLLKRVSDKTRAQAMSKAVINLILEKVVPLFCRCLRDYEHFYRNTVYADEGDYSTLYQQFMRHNGEQYQKLYQTLKAHPRFVLQDSRVEAMLEHHVFKV